MQKTDLQAQTNDDFQVLSEIGSCAPFGIYVYDVESKIFSQFNDEFRRIIGLTGGRFADEDFTPEKLFSVEDLPVWKKHLADLLEGKFDGKSKITIRLRGGREHLSRRISISSNPIGGRHSAEIAQIVGYVEDLTESNDTAFEITKLASIIEATEDAIIGKDFDGKILSWNKGAEKLFGFSADEAIGGNITMIFPREKLAEEKEIMTRVKQGIQVNLYETIRKRKDGNLIPISVTISPLKNADGEVIGISKIAKDISARRRAEEALRQSEERYRLFIKQSSEGIWRFEIDEPIDVNLPPEQQVLLFYEKSYVAECNDAMARQYGFRQAEEITGRRISDFLINTDSKNENYLRAFINSNYKLIDFESREVGAKDGGRYFLNNLTGIVENGKLIRAWGTQRDITSKRRSEIAFQEAEERRQNSQKIESIGRLAGGIAHDFNNFLAVIMLQTDMLALQLPSDSPLRFRINEIKAVSENAAGVVRQLLAFGRKQALQPQPIVLNRVIEEFLKIIRPFIGEDIEIKAELDDSLGVAFVDPNQVTQILMNLAINARDAMPNGGKILIETKNVTLSDHSEKRKIQPDGDYVQLCVADSGVGMSAKTKSRIFEPFFTTREAGTGNGLGLATVYGIVKQSDGFIWVDSRVSEGTIFKVQFPRVDQPESTAPEKNDDLVRLAGGRETILLVEDGDQVRRVTEDVLTTLGYRVFSAENGEKALKIAVQYTGKIDLLLTDVVMPKLNGKQVAEKIKLLHPHVPTLFMSGYDDDIISDHGILEEDVSFLPKPFTPARLDEKIREILKKTEKR